MLPPVQSPTEAYNRDFADYYDRITRHKDYAAEIETLTGFIRNNVRAERPRILDVGCGRIHAVLLATQGYDVTAIDLSPDMIRVALSKETQAKFMCGNVSRPGRWISIRLFPLQRCQLPGHARRPRRVPGEDPREAREGRDTPAGVLEPHCGHRRAAGGRRAHFRVRRGEDRQNGDADGGFSAAAPRPRISDRCLRRRGKASDKEVHGHAQPNFVYAD